MWGSICDSALTLASQDWTYRDIWDFLANCLSPTVSCMTEVSWGNRMGMWKT